MKKNNIAFTINNQDIPGSYWGMLVRQYGKWKAARFFYRAWYNNVRNPLRYIQAGIKKEYIFKACRGEDDHPAGVTAWIEENIFKHVPEEKPVKLWVKKIKEPALLTDILGEVMKGV